MVPSLLFDISSLDLDSVAYDTIEIEKINPHRGEMRLLDKIVYHHNPDPDHDCALAYLDIRQDAFWVAGHIPGRPIFPGVMIVEAAAQLCSFMCLKRIGSQAFMGFAGADKIKFRGQVAPGDRLWLLCQQQEFRPKRSICKTQALVNGTLVYEGTVTGMPM